MLYCPYNSHFAMRKYFLLVAVFALFSFVGTSLKKRISDSQYRYEFYTTDKVVSPQPDRYYHWFKGGTIHTSEYGIAGELLHEEFQKFYHSNQLAEAGKFKYGLKEGYWKLWFENGKLKSEAYWSSGQMDGSYYEYDNNGLLLLKGKYRDNKRHGTWIDYIKKDTLKFSSGLLIPKKVKDTLADKQKKPGFFKRLFAKKNKDTVAAPKNIAPEKVKNNPEKEKRAGFFRRLFYSKEKTNKKGEVKEIKNEDASKVKNSKNKQ